MILNPSILSLLLSSILLSLLVGYAFVLGIRISEQWDITSGSELQKRLERRTYLISSIMNMALALQLISLFLFIVTADALHSQLTGAMCAAGSLNANEYGYAVLMFKIANFLLSGVWLVINYVDNRGYDYPLIREKYAFLQVLGPLILLEALLQMLYFANLKSLVLTSCCGSTFGSGGNTVTSSIVEMQPLAAAALFYTALAAAIISGVYFLVSGKRAIVFSVLAGLALPVAMVSLIAFISPYYYELPSHHCPFCLLQSEYNHIGYALYLSMLGGSLSGISCGVLEPFRSRKSLRVIIPAAQKRLAGMTVLLYGIFILMVSWQLWFSNLRMSG